MARTSYSTANLRNRSFPARLKARLFRRADPYSDNSEPPLSEIVDDPITRSLMGSDSVGHDSLMTLLTRISASLETNRV